MGSNRFSRLEALNIYLSKMSNTTIRLKIIGLVLLVITLINIGILMGYSAGLTKLHDYQMMSFLLIVLGLSSIALALYYDVVRRDGNILFEELSNELHGKNSDIEESYEYEKIRLDAKVELRRFTHNSELPLIPGRYGPAILAALNLLIFLSYIIMSFGKTNV